MNTRILTSTIVAMAALSALVLSGCGGGGGGGGTQPMTDAGSMSNDGSTTSPPATSKTRTQALDDAVTAANAAAAIARAAGAQPNAGSVTQSSNVGSSNITADRVQVTTAQYSEDAVDFEVRNGTTWSTDTRDGISEPVFATPHPQYSAELTKRIEGGVLYVDLYSDIDDPTEVTTGGTYAFTFPGINVGRQYTSQMSNIDLPAVLDGVRGSANCTGCSFVYTTGQLQMTAGSMTFTPSDGSAATTLTAGTVTSTVPDADYLAGGVWLIVPDDVSSASDYEFGAFVDGNDPFLQSNLTALQGTATYEGEATGVYSEKEAGSTTVGYFDGNVELTAEFGGGNDLGAISGSITDFIVDDVHVDGTLNLGSASIGSRDSGFFKGSVTGSDDERSYTGHWGGQFFGNGESDDRPGSVAGTFGGHSTDDDVSFVGAFGAYKE